MIGRFRGKGPVDSFGARISSFGEMGEFIFPEGSRPPGVKVEKVDFNGQPAWQKSISTRKPGMRWWAELTIRRQSAGLKKLAENGVDPAKVLQDYEPGGALIVEHAGEMANTDLRLDPSLRLEYNLYFQQATRGLGWPRLGRVPIINQLVHDLKPANVGFSEGRGFVAFDPAVDPVTIGVGTALVSPLAVGWWKFLQSLTKTAHAAELNEDAKGSDNGGPVPASGDGGGGKPP